jgi:outer membrane receptor for ferrienterochelin and colicins
MGVPRAEPRVRLRSAALAIVVMAIVALVAPDLRAQDTPLSTEQLRDLPLEELLNIKTSTASLRPQEVREVPATTYIVTEEDFRVYGYRDLKDILRNLPGIEYVYPGSHLYGGQRGFSSFWDLTKLLINGREANAMTADSAFIVNQFNLTGVKRVEIVQGPASVLYGPEAFSGVINIVTKDAENSAEESELTGIAGGGDKSSHDGNGAFYTVAKRGPMALALGGYLDSSRGPDFTEFLKTRQYSELNRDLRSSLLDNGYPYRNDHRNHKFNADVSYSPMSRVQIKGGALYVRAEQGGGIESGMLSYASTNSIHEQTHFYASGEYESATVPMKTTLSYHHMVENFLNRFQAPVTMGNEPPYLAAFNFENTKLDVANLQVDYFPSSIDNYLLAGVGVRDTRIGEPAFTGHTPTDTPPGQPTSPVGRTLFPTTGYFSQLRPFLHQYRFYVYAQDQQNLWSKKIQITAGIRFDHHSIYGGILNVRSGLMLRPWRNYTIRGLFGQGFREPTAIDFQQNPELVPGRMNAWEASFLFTPVRHLSGQVAYFQNRASNLIVFGTTPTGFLPLNIGHKGVAGFESLVRYQVGPVAGDIWQNYEYSIDDQPLLGTAKNKLGFGAHYSYGEHLSLGLRAKYTSGVEGRAFDAERNQRSITVPAYLTLDANALAGDLAFAGVTWDVSFSILNILDRKNFYANTLSPDPSRYLAEGREYFGKVALRY